MLLPSVTELRRHMFLSPEGWGTHSHITKLTMLDNTSKNIFARCRNKFNDEHKFLSLCNSRILWFAKRISVNILIFPFLFKWIKTAYRITSKNYRSIHIVLCKIHETITLILLEDGEFPSIYPWHAPVDPNESFEEVRFATAPPPGSERKNPRCFNKMPSSIKVTPKGEHRGF